MGHLNCTSDRDPDMDWLDSHQVEPGQSRGYAERKETREIEYCGRDKTSEGDDIQYVNEQETFYTLCGK